MKRYEMELPAAVLKIINELEKRGYEAYAVGGCVRDSLLSREPGDWDITTSAEPLEVKSIFHKTIDTGIQHGTVTVMIGGEGYEVTTYRIDGEYEDGRHPKEVAFTADLRMDLERRDFTINAMAYNASVGLVDIFDGKGDLERKVIRCVGDAGQRFDEDALRMLRAVRFAGQLGFEIEEKTWEAARERAENLEKISAERIRVELTKLLVSPGAERIRDAYALGMTKVFLPELDRMMVCDQRNHHHIYTVGEHTVQSIIWMNRFFISYGREACSSEASAALEDVLSAYACRKIQEIVHDLDEKQHVLLTVTMLLHDVAKPETMTVDENGVGHFYGHPERSAVLSKDILKRLTFDNDTVETARRLIYYHDYRPVSSMKAVRKAASKIGKDIMWMEFLVRYADTLAQNPETYPEKLPQMDETMRIYEEIESKGQPLSIKDLAVNGKNLIQAGIRPGPGMGDVLGKLLDAVLEEPARNTRENLLRLVESMK